MKKPNRAAPIAASIAIQLCLGIAYIWSVFQTGIANSIFGGDNAAASLTFSLLLSTLTVGSVLGGKLAVKMTTRTVVIIGGVILSAGFFLPPLHLRRIHGFYGWGTALWEEWVWDLLIPPPLPAPKSGFRKRRDWSQESLFPPLALAAWCLPLSSSG